MPNLEVTINDFNDFNEPNDLNHLNHNNTGIVLWKKNTDCSSLMTVKRLWPA